MAQERTTVTLHLLAPDQEGPDAEECEGETVLYDRRDACSVRRAEAVVQERLGLSPAPLLCDEPESETWVTRWLFAPVMRLAGAVERRPCAGRVAPGASRPDRRAVYRNV